MGHIFYPLSFSVCYTVLEIIKQKEYCEYIFELSYSTLNHGLQTQLQLTKESLHSV